MHSQYILVGKRGGLKNWSCKKDKLSQLMLYKRGFGELIC